MVFAVVQHVCVFSPNDKKHLMKNYTLGLRLKISETGISYKKIVRLVFIVKFINAKILKYEIQRSARLFGRCVSDSLTCKSSWTVVSSS